MPNNKKKNKQKKKRNATAVAAATSSSSSVGEVNLNAQVLEALTRLAETLTQLDEAYDNDVDAPGNTVDGAVEVSDETTKPFEESAAIKKMNDDGAPGSTAVDGVAEEEVDETAKLVEETAAIKLDDDGEAEETTDITKNDTTDVTACPSPTAPPPSPATPQSPQTTTITLTPPALPLSHWRTLPLPVTSAYEILHDGASYIHATSTKYTLVGKVDSSEGGNLAIELRKGAELIGTSALLFFSPSCGASRSLRHYVKQSSRALLASVISLVQSFEDGVSQGAANDGNNVGAVKTGAVWSACDKLIQSLPKGNRAAMRRELMIWVRDCNESVEEFEEVLELGPLEDGGDGEEEGEDGMMDGMMEEEQYGKKEMKVAKASVNVMKCSKNLLGLVLKTCECVGECADKMLQEEEEEELVGEAVSTASMKDLEDGGAQTPQKQQKDEKRREMLQWISNLHEMGRTVGEGVTNFGILLYPPLDNSKNQEELERWHEKKLITTDTDTDESSSFVPSLGGTTLGLQLEHQLHALSECVEIVHGACLPVSGESIQRCMSKEVVDATARLRKAVKVRCREVEEAMTVWDRNGL